MEPGQEGDKSRKEKPKDEGLEGLKGQPLPKKYSSEWIRGELEDDVNGFLKPYLDALPDLATRGIKYIRIREGKIIGEVSIPQDGRSLYEELMLNILLQHGYDFRRKSAGGGLTRDVDELDLIRYRYFYFPEEEDRE